MKKYKDGKHHATSGEYKLSEVLHEIEAVKELTPDQKATYMFLYKQAFELGYAAAKENNDDRLNEILEGFREMTKEQIDQYISIRKSLNDAVYSYADLTE